MATSTLFSGPMSLEEVEERRSLREMSRIFIRPQSLPVAKIWLYGEYRNFERELFQLLFLILKANGQTKGSFELTVTDAMKNVGRGSPAHTVLSRLLAGVCALQCGSAGTPVHELQKVRRFLVRDALGPPPDDGADDGEEYEPWGSFRHCEHEAVVVQALFAGGTWFTSWAAAIKALLWTLDLEAPFCEGESPVTTITRLSNGVLLASDFVLARARHVRELSDGGHACLDRRTITYECDRTLARRQERAV